MNFAKLLNALAQREKSAGFEVKAYKFAGMSPVEQLRIASEAAVYVTAVGGGSVTGMFVPRGAGVIRCTAWLSFLLSFLSFFLLVILYCFNLCCVRMGGWFCVHC